MSDQSPSAEVRAERRITAGNSGWLNRRFFLTDLPIWLMLVLLSLGLPRTVLADLGVIAPEGSWFYYVLALTPFVVWLAIAVFRPSRRPFLDFLVLGLLYGLSLAVVHQLFLHVGDSLGHNPPTGALNFAERFSSSLREVTIRAYTVLIAMIIGVGTGLVVAFGRRHGQRCALETSLTGQPVTG